MPTVSLSLTHSALRKLFVGGVALFVVSLIDDLLLDVLDSGSFFPLRFIGIALITVPSWYFLYLKLLAFKMSVIS